MNPLEFPIPSTLSGWLFVILALIILWVIVSVPVYFAGKIILGGKASFGDAMAATLGGVLVYFIVFFAVAIFLGALIGSVAVILGVVLALIAWLAVYRASFDTGWIGALGIVVVAWLVLIVLDFILVLAFGVAFPKFYPFMVRVGL